MTGRGGSAIFFRKRAVKALYTPGLGEQRGVLKDSMNDKDSMIEILQFLKKNELVGIHVVQTPRPEV